MRSSLSLALVVATTLAAGMPVRSQAPARMMGAPYHSASRAFIDLMVPHHEMAIMMTEHEIAMGKSDTVKALARRMMAAQRQEIAELKDARRSLFGSDSSRSQMMRAMMQMMGTDRMHDSSSSHAMMDSMRMRQQPMTGMQHPGMTGMMSADMDRMFLEHMIGHHQDGIDISILAEDSQAASRVKQLARKIREGQERDIAEMRRLLGTLPAAAADTHRH